MAYNTSLKIKTEKNKLILRLRILNYQIASESSLINSYYFSGIKLAFNSEYDN